ncbi:MAG: LLM class flavin-dependent oxidoreductase [Anaerolineae bacterium]|nr:LLM class flavin-dependent oxidoreductase [Anaerolineae bacterium]
MIQLSLAFQTDKPLAEYGPLAALAEAQGFDLVSVYNDLFFQPPWLPLLLIAQHTRRVRLGPAAVNPFTCHPINLAGDLALLDEASGGRAYFGIARGAWLDALGLHPTRPIQAVREAVEIVQALLAGDTSGYSGQVFQLIPGERLRWTMHRPRVPVLLGAWGAQLIRATVDLIDEVKVGGTANPDLMPVMRQRIGRPEVGLAVGAVSVVDEDRSRAQVLARREVALYLPVVAALDPTYTPDPDEMARVQAAVAQGDRETAARAISDDTLRRFAFAGTPEDLVRHIGDLADAGATRVELGTPHGLDEAEAIRLLGQRVVPSFR